MEFTLASLYIFLAGVAISYFQTLWHVAVDYFTSKYHAHIVVDPYVATAIYDWLFEYFSREEFRACVSRVRPNIVGTRATDQCWQSRDVKETLTPIEYVPDGGNFYIPYKGRFVQCSLTKTKNASRPTIELSIYSRDGKGREFLEGMIMDVQKFYVGKRDDYIMVAVVTRRQWENIKIEKKKQGSVILKKGMEESILSDARTFLTQRKRYDELCIPYRRGYLFYGPPGTGKSSFVALLASILNLDICIINLSDPDLEDGDLSYFMRKVGVRSIVLFEDIDCVFKMRTPSVQTNDKKEDPDAKKNKVTMSGLLNAIDGVAAGEGRIVIMTTNHPEKLDPALIRPGRVDAKYLFDYADAHQIESIFYKFYPDANGKAKQFLENLSGQKVSMAELQTFLLTTSDPIVASQTAKAWIEEIRKQDNQ